MTCREDGYRLNRPVYRLFWPVQYSLRTLLFVVFLVACALAAYRVWTRAQIIRLPNGEDIVKIDLRHANSASQGQELPLEVGRPLVDVFRDARRFVKPADVVCIEWALPEYGLRITDDGGRKYDLLFYANGNHVIADGIRYEFPEENVPKLTKALADAIAAIGAR